MKMFGREVSPPKCPTCGHPLNLGRYSPKRSTDEYGDWYWGCEGCGYLRWTVFEMETKTVQEIIEENEEEDIDCEECHQAFLVRDFQHGQPYLICPACGYNRPE